MTAANLDSDSHLLPLNDEWGMWPSVFVRVAGMPFDWLETPITGVFAEDLAQADQRMAQIAAEPLFREAVQWQNPNLRERLHRYPHPDPSDHRQLRRALWTYAARYCAKNDTIGYFGPTIWGEWSSDGTSVGLAGEPPLARGTYFESWAIRVLANVLVRRHDLTPWTVPQLPTANVVTSAGIRVGDGSIVRLSATEQLIVEHCDGRRTVSDIIAELADIDPDMVAAELARLRSRWLITDGFPVTRGLAPERLLRGQLMRVGDPSRRDAALAELAEVVAARDTVAAAAGNPDLLDKALTSLDETFARITAGPARHSDGQFYSGRTPVYEDCQGDLNVRLDTRLLAEIGPALSLVLDAARWFAAAAAEDYDEFLTELVSSMRDRYPDGVPLLVIFEAVGETAQPGKPSPAERAAAQLRERWAQVLQPDYAAAQVHRSSADLAAAVREAFPAGPLRWAGARWMGPDLMFAGEPGSSLCVLGELHPAVNCVAPILYADHIHPDRGALHSWIDADMRGEKITPLWSLTGDVINSRTPPPDLYLSPHHTYLGLGSEAPYQPASAKLLPAAELRCHLGDHGRVRVRSMTGDYDADAAVVLGDLISAAIVQRHGILPTVAHRPRVTIDNLVICRESWRMPFTATPPTERGLEVKWRAFNKIRGELGLPRHTFAVVTGERKPFHVDLSNPVSMHLLASKITRRRAEFPQGTVTFTEMLPSPEQLWVRDRDDRRYTAEFRVMCVDRRRS